MSAGERGRLGDVLLGAVGSLGLDLPPEPAARMSSARARLGLPAATKACVVLVDGLGGHNLDQRSGSAPFLTGADRVGSVRTTFPSTTATNVTYLGTGWEGGRTRMLGYSVRAAPRAVVNLVSWNGPAVPEQWQAETTVFEHLEQAGRTAVSVGPWRFADSGLTRAAWRGGEYAAAESLRERVDTAVAELRDPDVDVVYLYWGELDSHGHRHGWQSPGWEELLAVTDAELDRLARLLPPGTLLLVTADHGMVDVAAHERIDLAGREDLTRDVDLVAGEPRAVHLYCAPGSANAVAGRYRAALGEQAQVLTRAEVIDSGMIGPTTPAAAPVVGDVVVAARGNQAVMDSRSQSAASLALVGMHGGVTDAETLVPLVVVQG
ncbi:alkaline phosphatase family protein [Ruania suaedae]|uniref:alkaline phosphatase family protein n=1 Tax=Ruania suaedae TaxID=2897774 RepID=UPI001E51D567|nr:nucleotide pyrophosphatase/phosphodiesterase family protein [Ruania suaedae]UFU01615.1 alkaline phosphatase family protein [Ruania suaedae]